MKALLYINLARQAAASTLTAEGLSGRHLSRNFLANPMTGLTSSSTSTNTRGSLRRHNKNSLLQSASSVITDTLHATAEKSHEELQAEINKLNEGYSQQMSEKVRKEVYAVLHEVSKISFRYFEKMFSDITAVD